MLEYLSKLPFVGSVVSFATGKLRLFVEYGLVALLLAVAGYSVAQYFQTQNLVKKNEDLQTRIGNIESQDALQDSTIETLQELRKRDAQTLKGLLDDWSDLAAKNKEAKGKLNILENNNARVKDYLDQPVPDELACMLNNSCDAATESLNQNRVSRPASPNAVSVPGARPKPVKDKPAGTAK